MKKLTLLLFFLINLYSCGVQWQYTTLNTVGQIDSIYSSSNVEADTINSIFDLKRKLRNDFNFRWDFAQYAMQQPYSFYWNNPRLDGIWRPYNRFDVYFYSNWFWTDWAYNYPFHHTWGWNNWYHWNRPYYYYGWYRPYRPWNNWYQGPFNNTSYNLVYNASRRGALTSNSSRRVNNISNRITVNRNKPRVNVNKPLVIPTINNNNSRPRVNYNSSSRPRVNNNSIPANNYSRPRINSNNYNSRPPANFSRSSNISRSSNSSRSSSGGRSNGVIKQR